MTSARLGLRIVSLLRFFPLLIVLALIPQQARADSSVSIDEAAKLLTDKVGDFRGQAAAYQPPDGFDEHFWRGVNVVSAAGRDYVSPKGEKLKVLMVKTSSDSVAYELLTKLTVGENKFPVLIHRDDVGTASVSRGSVAFFKGSAFVVVYAGMPQLKLETQRALARSLAATLDKGDGDIPVLVKHLPDWQRAQETAMYAISLEGLKLITRYQSLLEAIEFTSGTEAVIADYNQARMVIVEFTTPQLAGENDRRIAARIQELRAQRETVPAYRRVGNYSVFVFNASDEQAANQLIDQVKYEKVVQWLGDNPNWLKAAQERYVETTLSVFVSVVKGSGVALVLCCGIGGVFGTLLFLRRRAQQRTSEAYSDAGGMTRLNLDDLTAETDAARLIGPGKL